MSKKQTALRAAAALFELPAESLGRAVKVTVTAPDQVLVENYKGLRLYDRALIEIDGGPELLRLRGEGLQLRYILPGELLITGKIYTVDIE